jgi:hypothetical protein
MVGNQFNHLKLSSMEIICYYANLFIFDLFAQLMNSMLNRRNEIF